MVLYESTVMIHGRPYSLPDSFHRGAFLHFAPRNWKETVPHQMRSYQQQVTNMPYMSVKSKFNHFLKWLPV